MRTFNFSRIAFFGLIVTLDTINCMPISGATTSLFARKPNAWTPSPEFLAAQAASMELKYIKDPKTNATVINPAWETTTDYTASALSKRTEMNAPYGNECRISFSYNNYVNWCGNSPCPFQRNEMTISNHHNDGERYAVMDVPLDSNWHDYPLDGKRTVWAAARTKDWSPYGYEYVVGSLDGRFQDRDMMHGDWCWYNEGSAWWGQWGTAACSVWCSELYW